MASYTTQIAELHPQGLQISGEGRINIWKLPGDRDAAVPAIHRLL